MDSSQQLRSQRKAVAGTGVPQDKGNEKKMPACHEFNISSQLWDLHWKTWMLEFCGYHFPNLNSFQSRHLFVPPFAITNLKCSPQLWPSDVLLTNNLPSIFILFINKTQEAPVKVKIKREEVIPQNSQDIGEWWNELITRFSCSEANVILPQESVTLIHVVNRCTWPGQILSGNAPPPP